MQPTSFCWQGGRLERGMVHIVQGHPFFSGGWWRLKMTSEGGRCGGGGSGAEQRLTFRFRNFSVSRLFRRLRFRRIWYRKESLGFGFERFGLKKKSQFRFRKIWSRKKI